LILGGRNRGFTLIEALIAIVIVALTMLALLAVVPASFNDVQMDALEVQAVSVGQQFLDDERNAKLHGLATPVATSAPIDAGESFVGGSMSNYGSFAVTPDGCTTVQNPGVTSNVYSCSVSVRWIENGASRSVKVQSYVTK
jgi:prepilin-type N-terminal cleavage/methylation domain-containing protein